MEQETMVWLEDLIGNRDLLRGKCLCIPSL